MTYPTLTGKTSERILHLRAAGEEIDVNEHVVWRESEDSYSDSDASSLKAILMEIRKKYPDNLKPKSKHASDFEAEAAPALHASFDAKTFCADPEFWIWLTVVHFSALVTWRYGINSAPANFGIGATSENFLFRLWLRAELVVDSTLKDRYELARKGSSLDFWRSHLFRQSYANSRPFARALLRFQYPSAPDAPRLDTGAIRDLAKRLARLKSNLVVPCLQEDEALYLIELESQEVAISA